MVFGNWRKWLNQTIQEVRHGKRPRTQVNLWFFSFLDSMQLKVSSRRRLLVECLEDRTTPATLSPAFSLSIADAIQVASGDFNGDTFRDLAILRNDSFSILFSDGAGGFGSPLTKSLASTPTSFALGDFTGDGKLDVAVAYNTATVDTFAGGGDGTFSAAIASTFAGAMKKIAAVNLNRDAYQDIIGAGAGGGRLALANNSGTGVFTATESFTTTSIIVDFGVGDIDGDGDEDILGAFSGSTNFVTGFFSNGAGNFDFGSLLSPSTPTGVAVGDFNSDSKTDFVVSFNGNSPIIYKYQSGLRPDTTTLGSSGANLPAGDGILALKLNNDGIPDLAVFKASTNALSVYASNGVGSYTLDPDGADTVAGSAVFAADLDLDGFTDVVAANPASGTIDLYYNRFRTRTTITNSAATLNYGDSLTIDVQVLPAFDASQNANYGKLRGSVEFYINNVLAGTQTVSLLGQASLTVPTSSAMLPVGTPSIVAKYTGTPFFGASTSAAFQPTVQQGTVSASISGPTSGVVGDTLTFIVTLTPPVTPPQVNGPTGTINFFLDGSVPLDSISVVEATSPYTYTATLPTSLIPVETHTVTAQYSGDANWKSATTSNSVTVDVQQGPTITSANKATVTAKSPMPAFQLTATGTPSLITYSLVGAPSWLSINGANQLVGTPPANAANTAYNVQFTIKAHNGVASDDIQLFTLTVNPAMTFSRATLPAYTRNKLYSQTISTAGGTGARVVTYSLSAPLPRGLKITPASGASDAITISGKTSTARTIIITVTVTDSVGAKSTIKYTLKGSIPFIRFWS